MVGCSSNKNDLFEVVEYDCEIADEDLNLQFNFDGVMELPSKKMCDSHELLRDSIVWALFGSDFVDFSDKKVLKVYADSLFVEYQKVYDEIYNNEQCETNGHDQMMHNAQLCNFEINIKGSIVYYDSVIISYQRELYTYAGGAHGMTTKTNYVFDIKTGRILTEEDIFGKGFERRVSKLLTEKANILREEDKLPAEDEFYNNWNIVPNGNFALTDSSVIYTFNPYEIAPYCYGIIDIELKIEN